MTNVLPDSILNRKKEGFSIPMKNWLRHELQPLMRQLLSPERIARRGVVTTTDRNHRAPQGCTGRRQVAPERECLVKATLSFQCGLTRSAPSSVAQSLQYQSKPPSWNGAFRMKSWSFMAPS